VRAAPRLPLPRRHVRRSPRQRPPRRTSCSRPAAVPRRRRLRSCTLCWLTASWRRSRTSRSRSARWTRTQPAQTAQAARRRGPVSDAESRRQAVPCRATRATGVHRAPAAFAPALSWQRRRCALAAAAPPPCARRAAPTRTQVQATLLQARDVCAPARCLLSERARSRLMRRAADSPRRDSEAHRLASRLSRTDSDEASLSNTAIFSSSHAHTADPFTTLTTRD
jgi:hypothetical protein